MQLLHKSFTLELKAAGDDARTVEGWASTFCNIDSDDDIIAPGAFADSIKIKTPKMLWQHNSTQPIGVWDQCNETPQGLYVKGRILDTSLGNDAYKLALAGAIDSMSIGFTTKTYTVDRENGTRTIQAVDLWEVSLVTFPANAMARITGVKSQDGEFMTERQFEEFLRDVGRLSQKESKIVLSEGYKALLKLKHRDGADEEANHDLFKLFNRINLEGISQ
jgi:uncharacterized protein